jgi:hypothetical protein
MNHISESKKKIKNFKVLIKDKEAIVMKQTKSLKPKVHCKVETMTMNDEDQNSSMKAESI